MLIKCFNCEKEIDIDKALRLNNDADYVCDEKCKEEYEKKRDYFLSTVIQSDSLMNEWWKGNDFPK